MNKKINLGLKENWLQFTILVVVNAFVGGMVGLERTIFPKFAEEEFGITSHAAILTFIIAFGISKAITNYFAGKFANKIGRKNLLLIGWVFALPIPLLLMYAPTWNWVVLANVLLGINQGLAWSSTVVMKIDLVGEKDRGLAMGINEFSGYLAVGVVAFFTGLIAQEYGVTPYPFYLGIGISITGLVLTLLFVKDTRQFVKMEQKSTQSEKLDSVFLETSFKNKTLSAVTQAGLVNNLNDGMIWGLLPILLISLSYDSKSIGVVAAVYPAVWGIGQLFTGRMADVCSKKKMLFWGMFFQGLAILFIPYFINFYELIALASILGFGTALVYPTFLSVIADATSPQQRAESIGVFRLWRDMGYAIGAFVSGIIADVFGVTYAVLAIGVITVLSSMVIQFRMPRQSHQS